MRCRSDGQGTDTPTHERVRIDGEIVQVGLSSFAQQELGDLIHVQLPKIDSVARKGEHLGVVEGTLTAAEFNAPYDGIVVLVAMGLIRISDWLVTIERAPHATTKDRQTPCT
ncbi:MAG: hypothetical protein AB8B58_20100 [Roseobacter sp.]